MRRIGMCVFLVILGLAGCENHRGGDDLDAEKRHLAARDRAEELEKQVETLSAKVEDQKKQIETLQALGEKRVEYVFTVASVEIGRHSGGVNLDRRPGHDAVQVFLSPMDRDGHVLKAAGDVKIQLFDLAQPAERTLLAAYSFPVKDIAQHWAGGMLANQYSFECRLPDNANPAHRQITLHVTFVDYLTGKTFTAQKPLELSLPSNENNVSDTQPSGKND
ncbi:MAG: hypothetical protein JXA11_12050 [Phycisphaerae bacterium]|nr:hypothetical protein [Phycisphaerae bacterium]